MMFQFEIQEKSYVDDGIGGSQDEWHTVMNVTGWNDMLTGSNASNTTQNAIVERSTHVLIIPTFTEGIKDTMRVVDSSKRWYTITYCDDPLGAHHHNEIYLTFEGVLNG